MTKVQELRDGLSFQCWKLEKESLWTESGPGRLFLCLGFSGVVTSVSLSHQVVRTQWPWTASTALTIASAFVLGMMLWGYWLLIRMARKALLPALRRGEKSQFRPATKARYWTVFAIVLGATLGFRRNGLPSELLLLFSWPWAMIGGFEAFNAYRETVRLGFDLREEGLRSKLAPHFIFNTLNTLHAQIEADPKGAQATTENLANLFREVLAVSDRPTIPLKQELAFVEAYLGIEQARLGARLRVSVDIPEELESAPVPPLSLQVLVENAIKHGMAPLEQGGEVRIGAERKDGTLRLWVEDPGSGCSSHKGTGTALETLRQRLEKPEDLEMGMVGGRHRVGFRWRQA